MLLLKADGRLFCTAGRNPVQALAAYGAWTQPVPYANEMVSRALPSMEPCQCSQTQPACHAFATLQQSGPCFAGSDGGHAGLL